MEGVHSLSSGTPPKSPRHDDDGAEGVACGGYGGSCIPDDGTPTIVSKHELHTSADFAALGGSINAGACNYNMGAAHNDGSSEYSYSADRDCGGNCARGNARGKLSTQTKFM